MLRVSTRAWNCLLGVISCGSPDLPLTLKRSAELLYGLDEPHWMVGFLQGLADHQGLDRREARRVYRRAGMARRRPSPHPLRRCHRLLLRVRSAMANPRHRTRAHATIVRTNSGSSCRWLRMIPSLGTKSAIEPVVAPHARTGLHVPQTAEQCAKRGVRPVKDRGLAQWSADRNFLAAGERLA